MLARRPTCPVRCESQADELCPHPRERPPHGEALFPFQGHARARLDDRQRPERAEPTPRRPRPTERHHRGMSIVTDGATVADLPTTLQVGPHRWTIACDEAEINAASRNERCDLLGHTDPRTLQLLIRPGLAPDQEADTVLHETLHACFTFAGLDQDLDDTAENVVNRLAPVLLDTLRRNPELVAYLVSTP